MIKPAPGFAVRSELLGGKKNGVGFKEISPGTISKVKISDALYSTLGESSMCMLIESDCQNKGPRGANHRHEGHWCSKHNFERSAETSVYK